MASRPLIGFKLTEDDIRILDTAEAFYGVRTRADALRCVLRFWWNYEGEPPTPAGRARVKRLSDTIERIQEQERLDRMPDPKRSAAARKGYTTPQQRRARIEAAQAKLAREIAEHEKKRQRNTK